MILLFFSLLVSAQAFGVSKGVSPSSFRTNVGEPSQRALTYPSDDILKNLQNVVPLSHEDASRRNNPLSRGYSSVDSSQRLAFGSFWNWHLDFIQSQLTNVRGCPAQSRDGTIDFSSKQDEVSSLVNLCFQSDEYRKVRMTYYDGGKKFQVYQALWYPDAKYNLPILGVEMAQFGGATTKRHMMATDFQPIHSKESQHVSLYRHIIDPIREKYPSLHGRISDKYYDHTHFNEGSMLYSRFEDESMIERDVFPAVMEYVTAHVKMVKNTKPNPVDIPLAMQGQKAFDAYFAERDQAIHMFNAKYGKVWADSFVHDFLFELSR